jgi:hypothetical protein
VPEKPFNISQPNNDQVWACFQRCLSFEDPQGRWERLQNLISKQLHDETLKVRDFPGLPLEFQDHLFSTVYGFNGTNPSDLAFGNASVLLNVIFALEDIDNFEQIAFDSWKISLNEQRSKEISRMFPSSPDDTSIRQLAKDMDLSEAQHIWLQHARRAVPNWSLLFNSGPWSNDSRVIFICEQLREFKNASLWPKDFLAARAAFRTALAANRNELPGHFLPEVILLVEGETESILLPHFANLLGFDFSTMGVMLMSAGGARQVARRYFELRDVVTMPMVLCVDADAGEEIEVAKEALRDGDRLHIWKDGEIEDTLETQVLVQQLNAFLQSTGAPGTVSPNDFPAGQRRTVLLNKLWRARGLGNFDKIGFAEIIATNVKSRDDVPPDVVHALKMLETVRRSKNTRNKANA